MMTPQTAAMLQNNAGDPRMVSRIAQEQGLSREEVAQALKIPVEAAARYDVPAKPMGGDAGRPVIPDAGMVGGSTGADVMRGGGPPSILPVPSTAGAMGASMDGPALDGGLQTALPSITNMDGSAPPAAPQNMPMLQPSIADQGMKPAAPPPPTQGPQTKPMPVPKPGQPVAPQMGKPMLEKPAVSQPAGFGQPVVSAGLRQPMGGAGFRQPRGRPNLAGSQQRGVGEQAFVNAFNRMRGNVQ